MVTLAQSTRAATIPVSFATQGVDVVDEPGVETNPVSGVGTMFTSGSPIATTLAARPYARPVSVCAVTTTFSLPHGDVAGAFAPSPL